jgi:hypothetical protein
MGSKNTTERVVAPQERNPNWSTRESVYGAIEQAEGSKTEAAKILGVSRISLRHRIRELELEASSTGVAAVTHEETITGPLRSPLYDLSILKPETWQEKRPCWYCGMVFVPKRPHDWKQHYCCNEHKTAFHQNGYLPFDRLMVCLREEIRKQIKELLSESRAAA